ncbi:MAG: helix-turn-helix transcriptional regulator [Clostridiales bacterium]|nr:helix-turn-helix transcriptional regulator [Clostridiales bacterium]
MSNNNVRRFRQEQGYTLKKFADKAGVSFSYLCHLEKGSRKNPSRDVMKKIASALNKSIAETFFSEE